MTNSGLFVSFGGACALAFTLTVGCSGTDSAIGAAGAAGAMAAAGKSNASGGGSSTAGASSGGASSSSAGSSSVAGSTAIAGTSSWTANGGTSSSAGATSTSTAGASGAGDDCATFTTEAACIAATGCYPLYVYPPCTSMATSCPPTFNSCADTGCGPSCGAGSVCVGVTVEGGAVELPDAGVCPAGSHLTGQICQRDPKPSFSCQPAPAACNGKVDCACAGSLCIGCQSAEHNQIDCIEYVP